MQHHLTSIVSAYDAVARWLRGHIGWCGLAPLLISLAFIEGCSPASARPVTGQATSLAHIVPPCLSGETIQHVFQIHNSTGQMLHLHQGGVDQSCGCTTANVLTKEWRPHTDNEVTMFIKTDGKRGLVRERATVKWQAEDGQFFPMEFSLESEVSPAIDIVPPALVFRAADEGSSKTAAVRFQSPLPINWESLRCLGSSSLVAFAPTAVDRDGVAGEVRLLQPISELSKSYETATLQFQVTVAGSSTRLAGQTLVVTLPCSAYLRVPLAVSPTTVVARWDQARAIAAGRFMLRGDLVPELVAHGFDLESDAGEVSHRFIQTSKTQLIVTFDLKASPESRPGSCVLRVMAHDPATVVCEVPGLIEARVLD